ncbi:MAG: hypothetical protein ISR99_00760 [Parcubacteria group bacterium]|nr:hypothetical protein [Parcubacteria group bacterium]
MAGEFKDIVPPNVRSIRKVSVSNSRPQRMGAKKASAGSESQSANKATGGGSRRRSPRFGVWAIAVGSVLILVLAFSYIFSGAKVVVTPKQRTVIVDGDFEAYKNAGFGELAYEIMTVERSLSKAVTATGEESVSEKASGQIIVYNDYSSANQRLITNTRFETPDGLVYRINKPIVVPGQKKVDGKLVPGSVEATVYADSAGKKYNVGLTDFVVPGFKGDPRFDSFYARSKSSMTGGFEGVKKTVDKSDEALARSELQEDLSEQLRDDAKSQKPENFYLFDNATFIEFEAGQTEASGSNAKVVEKGTLYGVLFEKEAFSKFLAEETIGDFESTDVLELLTTDNLQLTSAEGSVPWSEESFTFKLGGNGYLIWVYDEGQLQSDLAGKSKGAIETVLSGYPSISSANVVVRPFWRRSFPDEADKIKIERTITAP